MITHTTYTDYHMVSMPYANSHVRFYVDNFSRLQTVELYSYNTLILSMDCNTWDKNRMIIYMYTRLLIIAVLRRVMLCVLLKS